MGHDWVCATCWSGSDASGICACGDDRVPFAAPGETPAMVIHFKLLDDPSAGQLLNLCNGPRLCQTDTVACRQHDRQTVWLWQYDAAKLGAVDLTLLRVLRHANLALFDIGDRSGYFHARYQRQRLGENPPNPDALLTDLERQFRELGQPPRFAAVALVEPWGELGGEFVQRLGYLSGRLGRFKTQAEALAWLLLFSPRIPVPKLTALNPCRVILADIGGSLALRMLARLHAETAKAVQAAPEGELVALHSWYKSIFQQTQAKASADSLRWGRLELLRKINPSLTDVMMPPWNGSMGQWWERTDIGVDYVDLDHSPLEHTAPPSPMVVGIGHWVEQGERQFARLLQRHWCGCWQPVILLKDAESDIKLLRWAHTHFPEAHIIPPPSFKASLRLLNSILVKPAPQIKTGSKNHV